jgi:hypothetical protein
VNFLLKDRQQKKSFEGGSLARGTARRMCTRFRTSLRLIASASCVQFELAPNHHSFFGDTVAVDVHRYQESIAGHSYLIEVRPVEQDRWRAYIVRIPGVPTALMPFYGPTPAEAARLLCEWLTRAHQQAAASTRTV